MTIQTPNRKVENTAAHQMGASATDVIAVAAAPCVERVEVYAMLTPPEVAEFLAVSLKTLERWRGTGEGPRFVKMSAGTVRYRAVDINAFIEAGVRDNTAQ